MDRQPEDTSFEDGIDRAWDSYLKERGGPALQRISDEMSAVVGGFMVRTFSQMRSGFMQDLVRPLRVEVNGIRADVADLGSAYGDLLERAHLEEAGCFTDERLEALAQRVAAILAERGGGT